ncbi:conserved hypothetical protein [Hyphomicrobiales bacterium]|nr:conserved hypothetical protein [Hyphomicrobiales bacterium]CAH1696925.1 conserved hypothetical protein [Hyphomicrobiales bacterium]
MKPCAYYPTPYGVTIPVFLDPDDPENFWHDIDGCMTMAAIHGKKARARCRKAIRGAMGKGGVPLDLLLEHGGRKVPRVALCRPERSVYKATLGGVGIDEILENWVTLALDHPSWDERAEGLLNVIEGNLTWSKDWDAPPEVCALGIAHLLTAAIEHLTEEHIDCLEAAALYALTLHPQWVNAAVEWLSPFSETWFADWIADRPAYRELAQFLPG